MSRNVPTREDWLNRLIRALRPAFLKAEHPLPDRLRAACGYTTKGAHCKSVGECIYDLSSADATTEIFIRPDQSDPMEVAAIALHELCHAAIGPGFNHGPVFKELATTMGLEGKMIATTAGPRARDLLQPILDRLGPYPHGAVVLMTSPQPGDPPALAHKNLNCPACGFHAKVWAHQMPMGRLHCPVDGEKLLLREERAEWEAEQEDEAA